MVTRALNKLLHFASGIIPSKIPAATLIKAERLLLISLCLVLGVLLIYSLALRSVISHYADRKDAAMELVSSILGIDVSAKTMELGQDVLSAWVRLEQVQVRTISGFPAITFGLLEFDIGFWTSLSAGRIAASQIRINDADVQLVQAADGRFGLAGGTGEVGINLQPIVNFLRDAETAHITSTRLRLNSDVPTLKGHPIDVRIDFENVLSASGRRLSAQLTRLSEVGTGKSLSLVGQYEGELREPESLTGRFRLQADNLNTDDWRTPLDWLGGQWVLSADHINLLLDMDGTNEFALHIDTDGAKSSFNGTRSESEDDSLADDAPLRINSPHFEAFVRRDDVDWQWQVVTAAGEMAELPLKALRLTGDLEGISDESQSILLTLDQADTEYLRRFLLRTNLLTPIQSHWLTNIKPIAKFNDFKLRLDLADDGPTQFAVSLQFQRASVKTFNAIPSVDNLSGELLIFEQGGILKFNQTTFDLDFPYLFDVPIEVNRGSGEVAFTLLPDAFFIMGNDIKLDTEYGFAIGDFAVNNSLDPDLRLLSLHFGFDRIGHRDQVLKLIPKPLSDGLKSWLNGALQNAHIARGGAIYHDHLRQNEGQPFDLSSIALLWDMNDVRFKYSDSWPAIQTPKVRAHITEADTEMFLPEGRMFDLDLTDLFVRVINDRPALGHSTIKATGNITGKLDQMMSFIHTTPLNELVGDEVLSWTISGQTMLASDLSVQLDWASGGKIVEEGTNVNLKGSIANASLYAPSIDLTFTDATGDLMIDSDAGVFAEKISFQTLGDHNEASIQSQWQSDKDNKISIKLAGKAHTSRIAEWLELPPLNLYEGVFKYLGDAYFTLSDETKVELVLTSLLQGMTIPMPKPFGKTAQDSLPITMLMTTTGGTDTIDLKFKVEPKTEREIQGLLEIKAGTLDRGIVRIRDGKPLTLPEAGSRLHVSGYIPSSDLGEWVDYTDSIAMTYHSASGGITDEPSALVTAVDVVTNVSVGDFVFRNSKVEIRRDEPNATLNVKATSLDGSGNFVVHDDDSLPIEAIIDELKVSTETGGEPLPEGAPEPDLLADINFADLVPMQVVIHSLLVDNESYGSWGFDVMPSANEVVFTKVTANIRGYELVNEEDSTVVWTRGEDGDRTTYKGRSKGSGLGAILSAWEYPGTFDTNTIKVTADVSWPGSPAMFGWLVISGDIEADLRRGELTTVDPSMVSLNKIIGILDISSWVRRLYLDFDDLKSEGISFDRLFGSFNIDQGFVTITEPVRMQGPGSTLSYTGKIDINSESLDGTMVATLPLAKSLAWGGIAYGALAAQPIAGLAVWLLARLFKGSFDQISSLNYSVKGSLLDPEIKFDSVFSKGEGRRKERQKIKIKSDPELDQGV